MPASKRGAALVALMICLLPAGARADELLVMPYACTMIGGRMLLSPGPEVGHRIIGQREQRRFTACSPANPGLCRHWTVHRFDLDCDGSRVPWVSVVAAAGETQRRAWLVDGRLQLRMGPQWGLAPDDPCAQEPGFDDVFPDRRRRRHCADRLALAPPVVEMPMGFAPMLGIDGIFVKAAPGISTAPPPLPPVVAAPPPAKSASVEPPQQPPASPPLWGPETTREPLAKEAPAKSPPPAQVAVQAPPKAVPAAPPAPAASDPPPATNLGPRKATIVESKPAPKVAEAPPAPAKEALPQGPPPSKTTAEPEDKAVTLNLLSILRTTTTGAFVAFAGLALGLLTAFALARRRERVHLAGLGPRDIASVSLEGKRAKPPARLGYARGRVPPNAAASAMGRVPGASVGAPKDWGDRMPRTKAEAFQVLGIGVTPSANESAIKKIVDGLRMSWHPDLAKDEADRVLRELRSKQINAAWELLHGQRAEA